MRPPVLLGLLFGLVVANPASADWPHVRGPAYDAISAEKGLADQWPADGPPVLWTRELGPGYSAIVVADGRAFTLFQTTAGMFLIALDADTGGEVWRERVGWPWQPGGLYPGPYASPTWHAGRIYYATPTGQVGCVEAADGHSVWTVDVRARFGTRGTEFGFASTPLVEGRLVILPVGGPNAAMVALNMADGSTAWAVGDDPASYCPALPIMLDGRRLVVGFLRNSLVLHDPTTGARVWRERMSASYDEHAAWPLFDGRHLLVASPFKIGSQLFRFSADGDGVTAKTVWAGRQLSNDVCSSLALDGAVYGFDLQQAQASTHRAARGAFKCLDLETGRVRWESDAVGQATPIAADGKLILWTEAGTLVLARANPERYEELARAQVLGGGGMCWAAPALDRKRLFVRDHQRAVCIYLGPSSELDPSRLTATLVAERPAFDWSRLLPREADFPNDAPTAGEIGRWFAWCVGVFGVAAGVAALTRLACRRWNAYAVFGIVAFVLGAVGTTALGARAGTLALTWPVSLYVLFRGVLWVGVGRSSQGWRRQVAARVGLLLFATACYGYYRLCLAVGFAMAWGFLIGFFPAAPFAVAAARLKNKWLWGLAEVLGFAVYFWSSGLVPGWKDGWAE
ncbi:outer membrane protein assembly factor BamB family protein [Limnoglobus roseus]|uniref:Alcohol dehydrogenase n=1 Tax=Limnoglobus roseus TaxID=2598579 RepID=A0A5C1ALL6_9BACT|nr:PQQ-binding-like beta-propeller repeat protein [Limnoglobus roseus]QEL19043.1 alcohol dehydrogenase [Limnoglobus roseus]